tara:strand:- start:3548 stop:5566 length:2019 start_codon:yes stop_codon:yes gene_type:complete
MNENKLKTIVQAELDSAIGYIESETTTERRKSLEAYLRRPYGTEVEGRSTIVTGEVAEAVDGAMPHLMRIFASSENAVKFEARNPQGVQIAEQITDYCNWVFYTQNEGFDILHETMKTALTQKVGIFKAYYEEKEHANTETYESLTEEEMTMLLADETREVVSQEITEEIIQNELGEAITKRNFAVEVRKKTSTGKIVVESLPPEEFLISKKGKTIADSPFCAHRKLVTRTDLVALGFDPEVVETLPAYDELSYTPERVSRFSEGEQPNDMESLDKSMEEIEVFECYLFTDFNDDGIAERRKVVYSGNEVLSNEEIDFNPFHAICPYPLPHKFFGQSLADRSMDIQEQKTAITRAILDSLYLSLAPRVGVVEGQANLDDLLNVTAGGVVRLKNPNAIVPMTVPQLANQAFPMLEYLDAVQGKRTGISDAMQGLAPDVLQNVTAAAIAASTNAATGKIELIARIFAETGIKSLFKGILHLACKYDSKPQIIRMRGKYINVDPSLWDTQYDVLVNVGLGTGDQKQQMSILQMVMQKQEEILKMFGPNNPLVSVGQYRETLAKFIETSGFKDTKQFFREITPEQDQMLAQQGQQKKQDPVVSAAMAQAQAQIAIDKQKAEADIAIKQRKMEADIQLQREKMMQELELKKQEFLAEAQIKATKVSNDMTGNTEIPN